MSGLYLEEGEKFVATSHRISVNFALYDIMLTSHNLVLIDSEKAQFEPWKIPLATVLAVNAGKIASGEPVITLTFGRKEGEEEPQPMNLLFTQFVGEQRKAERDEWIRSLMEQIVALRQRNLTREMVKKETKKTPQKPKISATKRGIDIPRPHSSVIHEEPMLVTMDVVPDERAITGEEPVPPVSPEPVYAEPEQVSKSPENAEAVTPEPQPEHISGHPLPAEEPAPVAQPPESTAPAPAVQEPEAPGEKTVPAREVPAEPPESKPVIPAEIMDDRRNVLPDKKPAQESAQVPPEEPVIAGPPHGKPPSKRDPSLQVLAAAALIFAILLAIAGGVWYAAQLAPDGSAVPVKTVTPEITRSTATGTPTPTIMVTTAVTTVSDRTSAGIPANGIWILVTCNESYVGKYGRPGSLTDVAGEGATLYRVAGDVALLQATFQKQRGTGSELVVEVYYNGIQVLTKSTRVPSGTIEFIIDPRTGQFPNPTPSPTSWTGFSPGETYRV